MVATLSPYINKVFPRRKEIALVLGNGPSLPCYQKQIESLSPNAILFGVNRIFLFDVRIDYFVALDKFVWKHDFDSIWNLHCKTYFSVKRYTTPSFYLDNLELLPRHKDPFHFATKWGDQVGHGYTSVFPCMQLAVMSGAKEIHVFGVDCKPNQDGKTHFYGSCNRRGRIWQNIRKGVDAGLENLKKLGIQYQVHSELYHA